MLNRIRSLVLVAVFAIGAVGISACGGTVCDDAADKIADCMGASGETASGNGECSGQAECAANCYNAASCDDIKALFTAPDPNNSLVKCAAACK